jgi:succinate dehydrogenase / fumarate reductase iron-sulfur subunit
MAKAVVPLKGPEETDWVFSQFEAERAQEFRMCIECFVCQDTCHVLREYRKFDEFGGPRTMVRLANFEMHPMDQEDRIPEAKDEFGIGYCNITKCCTDVCPAGINITDNAIIPLKERVVDRYYDPIKMIWRTITGQKLRT